MKSLEVLLESPSEGAVGNRGAPESAPEGGQGNGGLEGALPFNPPPRRRAPSRALPGAPPNSLSTFQSSHSTLGSTFQKHFQGFHA